jgi:transposase
MCAITLNGLYAYKIKVGSFKSADIVEFIHNELPLASQEERKILIMDNAAIHRTAEVSLALRERGYGVMFLPPYTPQLNPIEEFFSCLKNHIKQRPRSENTQSLIDCINDVLRNDVFDMDGYFNHMRQIIPLALSNADII